MRILYISYWGIDDALTKATVIPSIKLLRDYSKELFLCTMERSARYSDVILPRGVLHIPAINFHNLPRLFRKLFDFIILYSTLVKICKRHSVSTVVCRGAMAGAFGYLLYRRFKLPFHVESFEPHADYMVEGGTWKKTGIEYRIQSFFEVKQIRYATTLMPVSFNYYNELMKKRGVPPKRLMMMPCCVDVEKFRFNYEARCRIRQNLGISMDTIVGIYVGKFGDIYYEDESFVIFKESFNIFGNFYLIILSPDPRGKILEKLKKHKVFEGKVLVSHVQYDEVPDFLSASDFGFSLIKSTPSRRFCSPIKDGEYWANGLLTLLTAGVGDDEQIIRINSAGAIINTKIESIREGLFYLKSQMAKETREELSDRISPLAVQYRNFEIIEKGYRQIFE